MAMTIGEARRWVVEQYNTLLGRNPTQAELEQDARSVTQASPVDIQRWIMRNHSREYVTKLFRDHLGRDPLPSDYRMWEADLRRGPDGAAPFTHDVYTRTFSELPEALLRPNQVADDAGQNDARDIINQVLDAADLPELKDWAWKRIQEGDSPTRIEQLLRETPEYKKRYAGLIARREAGYAPMSEREWLDFEDGVKNIMRTNNMPKGFWDSPDDFVQLGASGQTLAELNERIANGYNRIANADPSIRRAFTEMFGANGDAALAAFYIDKDRAVPVLKQITDAAVAQGIGSQFGFDLNAYFQGASLPEHLANTGQAGRLALAGVDADQAREGFTRLAELKPLFQETISERQDLVAEVEGVNAVFGLGDPAVIERRRRERTAAFAGGGGTIIERTGTGLGAAE